MSANAGLLRAQLAKKTGCNLETIRYYEKVALLPEPSRSANGYRIYPPELVQRLTFILRARDLGFKLHEIRSLLTLTDSGNQTCAQVLSTTEKHLADIRQRIADLIRIETELDRLARLCSRDSKPECAILNVLNEG